MKIKRIKIVAIFILLISLVGCSSVKNSTGNNIVKNEVNNKEADQQLENIKIVEDQLNQLSFEGENYLVETFHAQFTIYNDNDGPIEFKLRIPHKLEEVDEKEAFFGFIDHSGKEAVFHLDAQESKEFLLGSKDYTVVSNLGPYKMGGLDGVVYDLVLT